MFSCGNGDNALEEIIKNGGSSSVAVKSITLTKTTLILSVSEADVHLNATVDPAGTAVTWLSNNTAAATVDETGKVHAVAAGTATITAKAGDKSATCEVTVIPKGTLVGLFSVGASKKVRFSRTNLQATYEDSKWTWYFHVNQWYYIGNDEGNTKISDSSPFVSGYTGSSTTVDLFGWVGASSTWTGVNKYGITSSDAIEVNNGYGDKNGDNGEKLKSDWGKTIDATGTTWRTLTIAEWTYLLSTRKVMVSSVEQASYGHGNVEGKNGLIILPDNWDGSVDANFTYGNSEWSNVYSSTTTPTWAQMEAAGCAFLPAAGWRDGTTISSVSSQGEYWSSDAAGSAALANNIKFSSNSLSVSDASQRKNGYSVRLVLDVE